MVDRRSETGIQKRVESEFGRRWSFVPVNEVAPLWWVAVAAVLVWADYMTGPYFQFPAVYVLPVTLAAWFSGPLAGMALALFLPLSRLALMLELWGEPWDATTIVATAITRVGVFSAMAVVAARLAAHERALSKEVHTLRSLLAICSDCRKIRDGDAWETLDVYMSRTREDLSAGLCPKCASIRFPEHFAPQ